MTAASIALPVGRDIQNMQAEIVVLALLLLAVVGVLALGLVSMARGGTFARQYGNKLMRARIVLQLLAVLLLVALFWLRPR